MKAVLIIATLWCVLNYVTPAKARIDAEEDDPYRFANISFLGPDGNEVVEDISHPDLQPRAAISAKDITLFFSTRSNKDSPLQLKISNLDDLLASDLYDKEKQNIFVTHGWKSDNEGDFNTVLKEAVLKRYDVNLFEVDWGKLANKNYISAAYSVRNVGEFVGGFINLMVAHYGISPANFLLVGHSLGAHVSGCAGAHVNGKVAYIVGLDPAGPLYSLGNTVDRLDPSDAEYVEVIHTCGARLGFASSIGHVDYFPNDGRKQPGCGPDVVGGCAHSRSFYYFEESILNGGFTSVNCDSYQLFKDGTCETNNKSALGPIDPKKRHYGDYYLDTNGQAPFSLF